MKKLVVLIMLFGGLNSFAKEANIIICECAISGSVANTSTTVSYEYGALGDCDHPAAGFGVATSTFGSTVIMEQVSNQEAADQCDYFSFSDLLCDWMGLFC